MVTQGGETARDWEARDSSAASPCPPHRCPQCRLPWGGPCAPPLPTLLPRLENQPAALRPCQPAGSGMSRADPWGIF